MSGWNELKSAVIDKDLCTLCGTCLGVCPVNTLAFDNIQETIINSGNRCINCSKCVQCCPGANFNYKEMNERLFRKEDAEYNSDIGTFTDIYVGQSNKEEILSGCSSGGLATAIGRYALEHEIVDYVIGITGNYPMYKVSAFDQVTKLYEAMGSKYLFIPINEIIRYILKNDGRYLYIGLPCQVQGLRKVCMNHPILSSKIKFCIAIFCGFNMERDATEYLIEKSNISRKHIKSVEYRATYGEKTGFKVTSDDGRSFFISKHGYTILNAFYTRTRCWKCYDLTGEFSDISLGDAWEKGHSWSRIIVRTKRAKQMLRDMASCGAIRLEKSSADDIYQTQKTLISYKKRTISTRKKWLKNFPQYNVSYPKNSPIADIKASLFLCAMAIGRTHIFRSLLKMFPIRLLEKVSEHLRKGNIKEVIQYLFWGIVTILTSFISYWLLIQIGIDYKIANIGGILITKATAYLTNKFFVFHSRCKNLGQLIQECLNFIIARGMSGIVEFVGVIFLVECLSVNIYFGKAIMIVITTIMNYFAGKKFVYKSSQKS